MAEMVEPVPDPSSSSNRRPTASYSDLPELSKPFYIDPATRSYRHQYSNIYFVRLVELRQIVEDRAKARWDHVRGKPPLLPRILNLQRGQLCYIVGTVYLDMPLKPNVLEDMARDQWIAPPPPRAKFYSGQDAVHLEDESGRVRLIGIVMAALGMETSAGDFEVIDLCFAGFPKVLKPDVEPSKSNGSDVKGKAKATHDSEMNGHDGEDADGSGKTWIAIVSGLSVGSQEAPADLKNQLLAEWLWGENGSAGDLQESDRIARLILAGNSLTSPVRGEDDKKPKRFNASTKPLYSSHPTKTLTVLLNDLLASGLPITLIPGPGDPAGATLPQQPLPKVMFGGKNAKGLECTTNPTWFEVGGRSLLGTGGQTISDIYKYLPSDSRLGMAKRTLEWRHIAPTAPDTLWVYPFPDVDPFILHKRPEIYVLGNQPDFQTALVGEEGEQTRIVLAPSFAETGLVVLVCLETLECKTVGFEVPTWVGDPGHENGVNGDVDMD